MAAPGFTAGKALVKSKGIYRISGYPYGHFSSRIESFIDTYSTDMGSEELEEEELEEESGDDNNGGGCTKLEN
jgi:hypothetical protein